MPHWSGEMSKTFILSLGPPAPHFFKFSKKCINPIIVLGRALLSRKLKLSMAHRPKEMSQNIFLLLVLSAPQFFANSKKLANSIIITEYTINRRKLKVLRPIGKKLNFGDPCWISKQNHIAYRMYIAYGV